MTKSNGMRSVGDVPERLKYVGIQRPEHIGEFGVEENASRLRRYEFIHRRLMFLQCLHLPRRALWELKTALGKHLYEDAEATSWLRRRILQLRHSQKALHREPDQRLTLVMDELMHARTDAELLVGIYEVIRPALLHAYMNHMETTQQVVDQPTLRILRQMVWDLEAQVEWGREAVAFFVDRAGKRHQAQEFKDHLERFLEIAGGVTGEGEQAEETAPRRRRSVESLGLPVRSVRDRRFPGAIHYRAGAADYAQNDTERQLFNKMRVRQEEMTAVELIAAVMWEKRDGEWEMLHELARHLWDEVRHSMFGQVACEAEGIDWTKYPQYTSDYDVNITNLPAAQYAWLAIGIEGGAMSRDGKRAEFEFCRDEAEHPLMTQFQDYDWADEVVHARFGRKWGPELYDGDQETARIAADRALEEFWEAVKQADSERPAPVRTDQEP